MMKRLCDHIAMKWEKSHSEVMGWVCARMAFAILRATNLCLCGSRVKWRYGHGMDDGAGLLHFLTDVVLLSVHFNACNYIYIWSMCMLGHSKCDYSFLSSARVIINPPLNVTIIFYLSEQIIRAAK